MRAGRVNRLAKLAAFLSSSSGRSGIVVVVGLAILLTPIGILLAPGIKSSPAKQQNSQMPEGQDRAPDAAPQVAGADTEEPAPATHPFRSVDVTLNRGDTLMKVLTKHGLEAASAHALIETVRPFFNPRKMRAGESFQLLLDPQSSAVQGLEYILNNVAVRVKSTADGWFAEKNDIPFVRETEVVRGTILDSLYENGIKAGLSPLQILDLATIFEYDIDFFSDFRRGDDFSVAFERIRYADGRYEIGNILAAEIEAGGEPFRAFYYTGKDRKGGYYNADGRAVRRAFLRAPLSYKKISSRYSLHRKHPIFRTVRPHRAIDYAAPAGTPVVAIGSGQVNFAGWQGGYGKMVEVRHPNGYVSRYAHFSRIASGVRRGRQIAQGEVVGYVGQTGHATGPHLHFEILRNGQKINFLSLRLPPAARLEKGDVDKFMAVRDRQIALLQGDSVDVARAQSPEKPDIPNR